MNNEKIWSALVGVKPLNGNEYITGFGAYVNVACVAENEEALISKLHYNFKYQKFEIFEIDDIENEDGMMADHKGNADKLKLIDEIKEGCQFAWNFSRF